MWSSAWDTVPAPTGHAATATVTLQRDRAGDAVRVLGLEKLTVKCTYLNKQDIWNQLSFHHPMSSYHAHVTHIPSHPQVPSMTPSITSGLLVTSLGTPRRSD